MTPKELQHQLKRIAQARLQLSIMMFGPENREVFKVRNQKHAQGTKFWRRMK